MTGPSLLTAAVDELYAAPLAEFTARRKALAAAAKTAGDRVAATEIGGLRKPTLSADTVNRLVRGAPDEVDELLQLGTDLRTAEAAFDAGELRQLGDRRRQLVNDLADLAFELTGQAKPSAAVREEVTATLNAALADDEVARRLSSGALVTQARWDGFGSTQLPELAAAMPDVPRPRTSPAKRAESTPRPAGAEPADSEPAEAKPRPAKSRPAKSRPGSRAASGIRAAASGPEKTQDAPAEPTTRDIAAERPATAKRATETETDRERRARERAEADQARQQREAAQRVAVQQAAADEAAEAAAQAATRAAEAQELVSTIDRRVSELNLQLAHQRRLLADAQRALRAAETERRTTALAATRAGAATR